MSPSDPESDHRTVPFPSRRKAVIHAIRVGRRMVPIHGLIEVDVTEARRRLAAERPRLSFTAYVVASVARAAAQHPEVHAYRDWRGRLVLHRQVGVATLIEVETPGGPFPLAHVIHDAAARSVPDISAEIRGVQAKTGDSGTGRALQRWGAIGARVPGFYPLLYRLMRRSTWARRKAGTVSVTAVGMFGGGPGYGIGAQTLNTLTVLVGGISTKPWVVDGVVVPREILDLTISIDHNLVDGAPAARFAATLRALLESAEILGEEG